MDSRALFSTLLVKNSGGKPWALPLGCVHQFGEYFQRARPPSVVFASLVDHNWPKGGFFAAKAEHLIIAAFVVGVGASREVSDELIEFVVGHAAELFLA